MPFLFLLPLNIPSPFLLFVLRSFISLSLTLFTLSPRLVVAVSFLRTLFFFACTPFVRSFLAFASSKPNTYPHTPHAYTPVSFSYPSFPVIFVFAPQDDPRVIYSPFFFHRFSFLRSLRPEGRSFDD
ncbi:hypothetical protein BDY24DRAFT_395763 [Mrakia frigida]|uniref:uncharacterized protein n=1 Tax=Mrakia frigida TaxID=29902 RepID=UPI003FCC1343